MKLLRTDVFLKDFQASRRQPARRQPVQLSPVQWGKRDPALGKAVCAHLQETMPAHEIPWVFSRDRYVVRHLCAACGWFAVLALVLVAVAVAR